MRKLADRQIVDARQMRADNLSWQAIGDAIGVSSSSVRRYLCHGARERCYKMNEKYYAAHREEIAAYQSMYDNEHKDVRRDYLAEYRAENKDLVHKQQQSWVEANRDRSHEAGKRYRETHLPENAAKSAARRAMLMGATAGNLMEIKEIYRQSKEDLVIRCYLCGELIPIGHRHVDHKVPLSRGGAHRPSNLAIACDTCNISKGAKTLEELDNG